MCVCVCVCVCVCPTQTHEQHATQDQFFLWNLTSWNSEFSFS